MHSSLNGSKTLVEPNDSSKSSSVSVEARTQPGIRSAVLSATSTTQLQSTKPVLASGTVATITKKPQQTALFTTQAHKFSILPAIKPHVWQPTLPILHTRPISSASQSPPVVVGDYVLYTDPRQAIAYYTLVQPRMVDMDLVVERDGDFRVTGGTATMVLSCYPAEDPTKFAKLYESWNKAIGIPQNRGASWKFQPLPLQTLEAQLNLPSTHERVAANITQNKTLGSATFLLELTALGAESWRQAISQGTAVIGTVGFSLGYSGRNSTSKLSYQARNLNASLATLLAVVDSSSIRVINPQVEVAALLVVSGHPSIANVVVELRSSFSPAQTHVFESAGGSASLSLIATDLSVHFVEWHAVVNFQIDDWPSIRVSGVLSQESGWAELLSPSSWMRELTITSLIVDSTGRVVAEANPADRVTGTLAIQADYIDNPAGLQTTFETHSEQISRAIIPQPPGEAPATVELTVFALRDGLSKMQTRTIEINENWVVVTVTAESDIRIATNTTPVSESGVAGELATELIRISQKNKPPQVRPLVYTSRRRSVNASAPTFTLAESQHEFWALEIAAHPNLMLERGAADRSANNYWFSYDARKKCFLRDKQFRLPDKIWQKMANNRQLFYRAYTSSLPNIWSAPMVTTADILIDDVPFLEIF